MNLTIIGTTDGRFVGSEFDGALPIVLGGYFEFHPDKPPVQIAPKVWRFANSNYVVDTKEI